MNIIYLNRSFSAENDYLLSEQNRLSIYGMKEEISSH